MATKLTSHHSTMVDLVDKLGIIKAQRAELEEKEKKIITRLKEYEPDEYHGRLYDCVIFDQPRTVIDWRTIADKCKIAPCLIARYTTQTPSLTCKVTARK